MTPWRLGGPCCCPTPTTRPDEHMPPRRAWPTSPAPARRGRWSSTSPTWSSAPTPPTALIGIDAANVAVLRSPSKFFGLAGGAGRRGVVAPAGASERCSRGRAGSVAGLGSRGGTGRRGPGRSRLGSRGPTDGRSGPTPCWLVGLPPPACARRPATFVGGLGDPLPPAGGRDGVPALVGARAAAAASSVSRDRGGCHGLAGRRLRLADSPPTRGPFVRAQVAGWRGCCRRTGRRRGGGGGGSSSRQAAVGAAPPASPAPSGRPPSVSR